MINYHKNMAFAAEHDAEGHSHGREIAEAAGDYRKAAEHEKHELAADADQAHYISQQYKFKAARVVSEQGSAGYGTVKYNEHFATSARFRAEHHELRLSTSTSMARAPNR